jgi:hypothetical protein
MKSVRAQFGPRRRPGRKAWIAIAVLAAGVAGLGGAAAWQARRVRDLGEQLAAVADQRKAAAEAVPRRPEPPYGDSARLFLRAHGAAWAPALRSLEGAAMIGVTPIRVEFDGVENAARAEIEYRDAEVLHEYLSRLNEGLPSSTPVGHWALIETHAQPSSLQSTQVSVGVEMKGGEAGIAIVRSTWR